MTPDGCLDLSLKKPSISPLSAASSSTTSHLSSAVADKSAAATTASHYNTSHSTASPPTAANTTNLNRKSVIQSVHKTLADGGSAGNATTAIAQTSTTHHLVSQSMVSFIVRLYESVG